MNLVGLAGEQNPRALRAMIDCGFDLHPHGWRWIDFDSLDEASEREFIRRSIEQVRDLTGLAPLGYYAGMPSLNTRRLVVEAGSFMEVRFIRDCCPVSRRNNYPWYFRGLRRILRRRS